MRFVEQPTSEFKIMSISTKIEIVIKAKWKLAKDLLKMQKLKKYIYRLAHFYCFLIIYFWNCSNLK